MGNEFGTPRYYNVQFVYDWYTINVTVETTDEESAIFEANDILIGDLGVKMRNYNECEAFEFV